MLVAKCSWFLKQINHACTLKYNFIIPPATKVEVHACNKLVLQSIPKLQVLGEDSVYESLMKICSYTASLTDGITVASFNKYRGNNI